MVSARMAINAPTKGDASAAVYMGGRTKRIVRIKLHGAVVRIQIYSHASPETAPAWQNTWQRSPWLAWEENNSTF